MVEEILGLEGEGIAEIAILAMVAERRFSTISGRKIRATRLT